MSKLDVSKIDAEGFPNKTGIRLRPDGLGGHHWDHWFPIGGIFAPIKLSYEGIFAFDVRDKSLWAWGNNTDGKCGIGSATLAILSPTRVAGEHRFRMIGCTEQNNENHAVALREDGTAWSWGSGVAGRLGVGSIVSYNSPVSVHGNHTFVKVVARDGGCTGLRKDGTVWSWGSGADGVLGDDTIIDKLTPVSVVGGHSFVDIEVHARRILAIKEDGTVWSWGNNDNGTLGLGDIVHRSSPVMIVGHVFTRIGTSNAWGDFVDSSYGFKEDDSLWMWGNGTYGVLGNGSISDKFVPTSVSGGHNFVDIQVYDHVIALREDGTAWSWGHNLNGEIGNNTSPTDLNVPTSVNGGHIFVKVARLHSSSYGIDENGQVWSWGFNTFGELGDGTTIGKLVPVSVTGNHSFVDIIGANEATIAARKDDGSLWMWGSHGDGQCGDGTAITDAKPDPVMVLHNFGW